MRPLALAVLSLVATASAQDLIAVDWSGRLIQLDSHSLATRIIGSTLPGLEGLAVDGGLVWSIRQGSTPGFGLLVTVDLATGVAGVVRSTPDVISLTGDGNGTLWVVRLPGASSTFPSFPTLGQIGLASGQQTVFPPWPLASPQPLALVFHQGTLFAWDRLAGLLVINPVTGAIVRSFPGAVPSAHGCTFLVSNSDGRLLCGFPEGPLFHLGEVDPATGRVTDLGSIGTFYLHGCLPIGRRWWGAFGAPCNDVAGLPTLRLGGYAFLEPGALVTATSDNHATGTIGTMIFGASNTVYGGQPLPLLLDPLLGTAGCSLYVSADVSLLGSTPAFVPALLAFTFPIPAVAPGFTFYAQHAAFAPVPGMTSWSNAVAVRL